MNGELNDKWNFKLILKNQDQKQIPATETKRNVARYIWPFVE